MLRVSVLNVEQVVPGHGPPATLKEVREFREMLAALLDSATDAVATGMEESEAVDRVRLPAYESLPRYKEWMP